MNLEAIAFHEVGHAYAGFCCGRWGKLKEISIIPSKVETARCVWIDGTGPVPEEEKNGEIASRLSGPITQVWFTPESVGEHLKVLSQSVVQHRDFYRNPPMSAWWNDVQTCVWMSERNLPKHMRIPWEDIEEKLRELLKRPTVDSGIRKVTEALLVSHRLAGSEVEAIFRTHLNASDTPGFDYFAS